MTRATTSQPETTPENGTGPRPASAEEADLEFNGQSYGRQHTHLYSHDSNDWNQDEVQWLKVPYREPQSSQGDVSSIIRDAGFSLDRFSLVEHRRPEQVFDDDLTALGAQFDPETAVSRQTGGISAPINPPHYLDNLLRSKQVVSAERGNDQFIPINELELAISPLNVYQELQHAGVQKNLKELTASICRQGKESRQRLFAILCMIQLPAQIITFIEVGIFDGHLPFDFRINGVYRCTSADPQGSSEALSFFQSDPWKPYMADSFRTYQRQVSAPVFKLSWASGEKVRHYPLNEQLVLPFMRVEDTSKEGNLAATLRRLGGTSIVRKVKIHPAHYNANPSTKYERGSTIATRAFDTSEGEGEADFAVKELGLDRRKDDQEALALKRLNDKPDPHLITLLVTYRYDNRFHMVFPWADGNLKDLWETSFPNIHLGSRSPGLVKWIAAQIVGLARALSLIHFCPIENSNVQDLPPEDKNKPHGRHGDLKPENILWFRSEQGPHIDGKGTLKIADFGFADFRSEHSRSNVRRSDIDGITPTYRAPEYDVNRRVSPQYDIWSFGCILLEFVVWYMWGWQGVDLFSKDRVADYKGTSIASDLFYELGGDPSRGITASAKLSVIMIFENLKNSKACSDYFLDLLEYIQTALLRVNNAKRAKIEEIVGRFAKMSLACEQDEDYCMLRTRPARRTDSGLSEIVEIPNAPSNELPICAPPTLQGKGLHRRSASVSSQLDILRGKKRQDSFPKVSEGDQPRSKSPLTQANSITHSSVSADKEKKQSPTQSEESFESTPTMRPKEHGTLQAIENVVDLAHMPTNSRASFLLADEHGTGASDTPNENAKSPPLSLHETRERSAADQVPTIETGEHTSYLLQPHSTLTVPGPDMAVQPHRPSSQDIPNTTAERHNSSQEEHTSNGTKETTARAIWRRSKQRVHGRALGLLNWCFKEGPG